MVQGLPGQLNPKWAGGICSIETLDDLLKFPSYCDEKQKFFIENSLNTGGCWNWLLAKNDRGRARVSLGNKNRMAARVAYVIFKRRPIGNLQVCHSCDNLLCVNPEHLWLGTQKDNIADMYRKGRNNSVSVQGEDSPLSKLTDEKVIEMRSLFVLGWKQSWLAKRYSVHPSVVSLVVRRLMWKHI